MKSKGRQEGSFSEWKIILCDIMNAVNFCDPKKTKNMQIY